MKTLTLAAAALATAASFTVPALAESTVNQQQYKLERILASQGKAQVQAKTPNGPVVSTRSSQGRVISARMLTGPEKALARLKRVQPDAATGGR